MTESNAESVHYVICCYSIRFLARCPFHDRPIKAIEVKLRTIGICGNDLLADRQIVGEPFQFVPIGRFDLLIHLVVLVSTTELGSFAKGTLAFKALRTAQCPRSSCLGGGAPPQLTGAGRILPRNCR